METSLSGISFSPFGRWPQNENDGKPVKFQTSLHVLPIYSVSTFHFEFIYGYDLMVT